MTSSSFPTTTTTTSSSSSLSSSSSSTPPLTPPPQLEEKSLSDNTMKKVCSMNEKMSKARHVEVEVINEEMNEAEGDDYMCIECGKDNTHGQLLKCNDCDKCLHTYCARPEVPCIPKKWFCSSCCSPDMIVSRFPREKIDEFLGIDACEKDPIKRRKLPSRTTLLPFTPTKDNKRRLVQMGSLAYALTVMKIEFTDELIYVAPESANQEKHENGHIQVLPKKDIEILQHCKTMCKRGEFPPLRVVYDPYLGFTINADEPIKKNTLLGEYTGEVDYYQNWEYDGCDSVWTLLTTNDKSTDLIIKADKYGNVVRFLSGVNNNDRESEKKINVQAWRYNVKGKIRVIVVAKRKIEKGERLYLNYNGDANDYPTGHFH